MDIVNAISNSLGVADVAWESNCRDEDLKYRALENERREVDDARRAVNEKAEQLKAISGLSALVAGFAMVKLHSWSLNSKPFHPTLEIY